MTYLLDTNVCVKLLNNSSRSIVQRNINLLTVVAFELFYGAYHSQKRDNNLEKLERFLNQFRVIEFDRKAAKICGSLRSSLNKKGTPIGGYDLQIAIYLPPYSPDFSPIENYWSKIKSSLRRIGARTYADLLKALEQAFAEVTSEDLLGWFTHCCYTS